MKIIKGFHLTATEKKAIKFLLSHGVYNSKVGLKNYKIEQLSEFVFSIKIAEKRFIESKQKMGWEVQNLEVEFSASELKKCMPWIIVDAEGNLLYSGEKQEMIYAFTFLCADISNFADIEDYLTEEMQISWEQINSKFVVNGPSPLVLGQLIEHRTENAQKGILRYRSEWIEFEDPSERVFQQFSFLLDTY